MTKEEFKPIARTLKHAYRREDFFNDTAILETWLRLLEDLDADILQKAVDNYIREAKYQPTIADIRTEYAKIIKEQSEIKMRLMEIYDRTRGIYPDMHLNDDDETRKIASEKALYAWERLITSENCPLEKQIERAMRIEEITGAYVKKVEANPAIKKIPTLEEFFKGAR